MRKYFNKDGVELKLGDKVTVIKKWKDDFCETMMKTVYILDENNLTNLIAEGAIIVKDNECRKFFYNRLYHNLINCTYFWDIIKVIERDYPEAFDTMLKEEAKKFYTEKGLSREEILKKLKELENE